MNWIKVETESDIPLGVEILAQCTGKRYVVLNFYFDGEFQRILAPDYESFICCDEVVKFYVID